MLFSLVLGCQLLACGQLTLAHLLNRVLTEFTKLLLCIRVADRVIVHSLWLVYLFDLARVVFNVLKHLIRIL